MQLSHSQKQSCPFFAFVSFLPVTDHPSCPFTMTYSTSIIQETSISTMQIMFLIPNPQVIRCLFQTLTSIKYLGTCMIHNHIYPMICYQQAESIGNLKIPLKITGAVQGQSTWAALIHFTWLSTSHITDRFCALVWKTVYTLNIFWYFACFSNWGTFDRLHIFGQWRPDIDFKPWSLGHWNNKTKIYCC